MSQVRSRKDSASNTDKKDDKSGVAPDKKPRSTSEDDLYRNSTQYRLWSFTEEQLKDKRADVTASGRRIVLKKLKVLCDSSENNYNFEDLKNLLELVSEEEEMKEISYYVGVLQKLSTSVLKLPSQVRATAIAFLKRFYLTHSVMEYHPKKILSTCLFLAAKSENCFMSPKTLAEYLGKKTTPESILELEFTIVQSLCFTLLCHHPYRPLHGFFFDFQSVLIRKHPNGVVVVRKDEKTNEKKKVRIKFPQDRVMKGYIAAREYIDHSLISDASFLYTPPQIALACFLKVDEEMTISYLTYKFVKDQKKKDSDEVADDVNEGVTEKGEEKPAVKKESEEPVPKKEDGTPQNGRAEDETPENNSKEDKQKTAKKAEAEAEKQHNIAFYKKLLRTLRACLKTIENIHNPSLDEAKNIDKKVHYCINPDKLLKRKRQESPESGGGDNKRIKLEQVDG